MTMRQWYCTQWGGAMKGISKQNQQPARPFEHCKQSMWGECVLKKHTKSSQIKKKSYHFNFLKNCLALYRPNKVEQLLIISVSVKASHQQHWLCFPVNVPVGPQACVKQVWKTHDGQVSPLFSCNLKDTLLLQSLKCRHRALCSCGPQGRHGNRSHAARCSASLACSCTVQKHAEWNLWSRLLTALYTTCLKRASEFNFNTGMGCSGSRMMSSIFPACT